MVNNYAKKKITIMGLGLHGGGSASARFFAEEGAEVTVTDLRNKEILDKSIKDLSDLNIKFVLGHHDEQDFFNADIVIKNPAVKPDSPFLKAALKGGALIETDISTFLHLNSRPIIAVTGSKGKSTTVSAIYHVLKSIYPETNLGGNITVSPLTFYSEENNKSDAPVILELSSWQLADLANKNLLHPTVSAITNIMHDHQDRYHSMDNYAADKAIIFEAQKESAPLLLNADSEYTEYFAEKADCPIFFFSSKPINKDVEGAFIDNNGCGWWQENNETTKILNSENTVTGSHNKINLLTAAAILFKFGISPEQIRIKLSEFPGIAHRLEFVREKNSIKWYNDSAATIPEAAAAAVESFSEPMHLITGGTDKELDFSPLIESIKKNRPASINLLEGTGTEKIITLLQEKNLDFNGPYNSLDKAIEKIAIKAKSNQIVLLSPGCASFGMFKNEFDRGNKFKALVNNL
ncbi:MAG: UDP-N-acetylmuramoyl-L-alanine--D-glutamate ligase [Spirochaetales bacterium]|nr:UDP-N-acetylmuramoyl-L-alanine--D-glutamate ligase [Spirochaetales bacterium]